MQVPNPLSQPPGRLPGEFDGDDGPILLEELYQRSHADGERLHDEPFQLPSRRNGRAFVQADEVDQSGLDKRGLRVSVRELEEDVFLGRRFLVSGLDGDFDGDDLLRPATDQSPI
jgi:hypothetical protein